MATLQDTGQETEQETAAYVYGIVPADVEAEEDVQGIGDPPRPVTVVRHGPVAALVSEIGVRTPLGTPEDLAAHARILDAAAGEVPVLPLRFGAVLTDVGAVAEELLAANEEDFAAALQELEGRAQYIVKGRYDEQAILSEIMSENADAARLRDAIRDTSEDASRAERIALGELISNTVAAKREADTRVAVDKLGNLGADVAVRESTHELDAVYVACLAEVGKQSDLENAVGELAAHWQDRVHLRLLGPLAAYDFVTTHQGRG